MMNAPHRPIPALEHGGLDLRRLRYFVAVCDSGGFSRAASAIGIAQPALTRQVKLLETEVGLPLIVRTARGATPTEEGRYLLARCREHLDGLDNLVRDLRQHFSGVAGPIVLGICPTIAPFFLDDITGYVREAHPSLALSVIQAYSGDLQNLMAVGGLDLALTYRPQRSAGAKCIVLFSERLVLVSGHPFDDDPATGGGTPRTLILPSRIHELRRIIDTVAARHALDLTPGLELDSLDAVKSVLADPTERHATILPYYSVRREIAAGAFHVREFDLPDMHRTIAVVRPARSRNKPGANVITSFVVGRAERLKAEVDTVF